jgi:hypothetical protein
MTLNPTPIARTGALKQGKPLAHKTPMRRTGFKAPAASAGLLRVAAVQLKTRKPMKKSRAKSTPARRGARPRLHADDPGRGQPRPGHDRAVPLQPPGRRQGHGPEAPDSATCFGCSDCHDVLDGRRLLPGWMTRQQLEDTFDRATVITQEQLKQEGITA